MNLKKLKEIEEEFLTFYPTGFEDAKFFPTMKKFNPSKLEEFTKENLKKESFSNPNLVVHSFFNIIQNIDADIQIVSLGKSASSNYKKLALSLNVDIFETKNISKKLSSPFAYFLFFSLFPEEINFPFSPL